MDQDDLGTYQEEHLPDEAFWGQILTGNSAGSDLLRWLYADHNYREQIDREMSFMLSRGIPETWKKQCAYFDAYQDQEKAREAHRTGPGDG